MTRTTAVATVLMFAAAVTGCGHSTQTLSSGSPAHAASPTPKPTPATACATHSGFELSLVSDRGGQRTPIRASAWFARHGRVAEIPVSGWHLEGKDAMGVFTRSGRVRLHVVQGQDKTWQVDSGENCSR